MWGMRPEGHTCPNCGKSGFNSDKEGFECESCGFHKIPTTELPEVDLIFCHGCGCHLMGWCTVHPPERQVKVKFK